MTASPVSAKELVTPPNRGFGLPRVVYPFRALGVAAGFLAVATVFRETGAHPIVWAMAAFHGVIWSHLAFFVARTSVNP